jgi:hypothetical protein
VPLVYHTGGRCVIREVASGTTVPSPVAETANVHTTGAGTFLADSSVNVI